MNEPSREARPGFHTRWADADLDQALALRRWALELFVLRSASPPPPAARATWAFFLSAERCALPLSAAIRSAGIQLTTVAALPLERQSSRDLRRNAAAAEAIRTLDAAARQHGFKIVLLKGARLAAERSFMFLLDIDVLVPDREAVGVAEHLATLGYTAKEADSHERPHLATRIREGSLPIEVHRFMRGMPDPELLLRRSVPCEGTESLWKLEASDHLRHLLFHSIVHHPERTGRLRDVLTLAHSITAARPDDMDLAVQAMPGPVERGAAHSLVQLAGAVNHGGRATDPFADAAAKRYGLLIRFQGVPQIGRTLVRATQIASDGRTFRKELRLVMAPSLSGPSSKAVGYLARVPVLGSAIRAGGRVALSCAAMLLSRMGRVANHRTT